MMQATVEKIWTKTTKQIRTLLNTETYNLWFSSVQPVSLNQSSITLEVPNEFSEVWLKDNYLELPNRPRDGSPPRARPPMAT